MAASSPNYTGPFITITILFCIFGFITSLNNALVPHMKSIFDLSYGPAMLTTSAFFLAYFFFSLPSSWLIERIGYKRTIVISLLVQVIGAALFIPAAKLVNFPLFLLAIFILAAGVTALQTAANPYVSILGPESSAPVRLTLAQAFNSLGQAAGPLVAGWFILTDPTKIATKAAIAQTVQVPFVAIAGGLLILGLAVMFTSLPAIASTRAFRPATDGDPLLGRSIWSYRHTVLSAVGIFFYVGVEVTLAGVAINYFLAQGVSTPKIAGMLVSFYWIGSLIGRFLGSWMLTFIKANKLLTVFGFLGVVFLLISMFSTGPVAIWTLILCGFANSIMFPNIFALGVAGLGPMTSKGSGIITTAIVGGAVIPPIYGTLVDRVGMQYAFIVPIICYLYIAYFGMSGYKPTDSEA
jgi:FHS family L-fucose permease-like MFS transporter